MTTSERHATSGAIRKFAFALTLLTFEADKAGYLTWTNTITSDPNEFVIKLIEMAPDWTAADFDALREHLAPAGGVPVRPDLRVVDDDPGPRSG